MARFGFGFPLGDPPRNMGGGAAFNPASLFAAGEQGVWYDPSDMSSMFQDAAGTIPAVVDQPVGRINDKSGRSNHATQTIPDARPILRQGGGLSWLEFDGSNDAFSTEPFVLNAAGKTATSLTGVRDTKDGLRLIWETSANANNAVGGLALVLNEGGPRAGHVVNGGTVNGVTVQNPYSESAVLSCAFDTSQPSARTRIIPRRNGSPGVFALEYAPPGGASNLSASLPLYIGARAGTAFFAGMRLFGLMLLGRSALPEELVAAERYMAARSGVTLP